MAIYEPEPKLSATERSLLLLLAQLVTDAEGGANYPTDRSILSDGEATLLIELLEEFASSKKFVESSCFVERLTQSDIGDDSDIREIYFSWRKFYGRSRSMASTHWEDFLRRFGRIKSHPQYRGIVRAPYEMPYSHFREMERLLLRRSKVDVRVASIVLAVVDKFEREVEAARVGDLPLSKGALSNLPQSIANSLREERQSRISSLSLSSAQAAGLMTVLTDVSVLFTTRDWGVAGTISTIGGGLAAAGYPQK